MNKPGKIGGLALSSLLKKPATTKYPFVKEPMIGKFRGKIKFSQPLCIGCKICMRDCPSNAIDIVKIGEKQFDAILDLGKCIYCAQCCDSCPKKALEITGEYELAVLDPKTLKVKL